MKKKQDTLNILFIVLLDGRIIDIYHQQTLDPVINHYGISWNSEKNMKINILPYLVMVDSHLIRKMKKFQFYQQSLSNALIKVRRIRIQSFLQKRKKKQSHFIIPCCCGEHPCTSKTLENSCWVLLTLNSFKPNSSNQS